MSEDGRDKARRNTMKDLKAGNVETRDEQCRTVGAGAGAAKELYVG